MKFYFTFMLAFQSANTLKTDAMLAFQSIIADANASAETDAAVNQVKANSNAVDTPNEIWVHGIWRPFKKWIAEGKDELGDSHLPTFATVTGVEVEEQDENKYEQNSNDGYALTKLVKILQNYDIYKKENDANMINGDGNWVTVTLEERLQFTEDRLRTIEDTCGAKIAALEHIIQNIGAAALAPPTE